MKIAVITHTKTLEEGIVSRKGLTGGHGDTSEVGGIVPKPISLCFLEVDLHCAFPIGFFRKEALGNGCSWLGNPICVVRSGLRVFGIVFDF